MTKQTKLDKDAQIFLHSIKDPERKQRFYTYLIELNSLFEITDQMVNESRQQAIRKVKK
jgi:hypothetical protein